jgi:hypothetical protein
LVTIVPHTTSARGSRFETSVAVPFLRAGVFDAQNLVTIPHAKLIRALGKLSAAQLAVVERATIIWFGLSLTTSRVANIQMAPTRRASRVIMSAWRAAHLYHQTDSSSWEEQ